MLMFALVAGIAMGVLWPWVQSAGAEPTVTVSANVNLSRAAGNQSVGAIAIDPRNVNRVFVVSQDETGRLFAARTSDGGATWAHGKIATGVGPDGLPAACCNPSVSWDTYGNLFITYLGTQPTFYVVLAVSTDGGATFTHPVALAKNADQPTVATGPDGSGQGSVWVTYNRGAVYATGAPVSGLGAVGSFRPAEVLSPSGLNLNYGDIAVGPSGQVMVTYGPGSGGPDTAIYTNVKADGLGPGSFAPAHMVAATHVGGFTALPAQPNWGIDPEAGLAYDRSGGPYTGRVYLVYTDAPSVGSYDTDIFVRFSDDDGATWSGPVRVNDDATANSQFLPRIALDQATGAIAVTWHDTREDLSNVAARYYGAVSADGAATFTPNFPISAGASREAGADPPASGYHDIDFGDYTGSAFVNGVLMPVWADNSNSTADNPDGTLARFDIYTAAVLVRIERSVTAVGPAQVWVGLKNSDDVGLRVDLLAQVFIGTTKVGEGQVVDVASGGSGFNNAALHPIRLSLTEASAPIPPGAQMQFTVGARRTCVGRGHSTGTLRLWYNAQAIDTGQTRAAGTRFDVSIDGTRTTYFLRTNAALSVTPGTARLSTDTLLTSRSACPDRPFTPFGTWSITQP